MFIYKIFQYTDINNVKPQVIAPIETQNSILPTKTQNKTDLLIVVEPIEAQNNLPIEAQNKTDLPIVVEPIEAQNNLPIEAQNKTDLPIVVEPIEAQNNLPIKAQNKTDLPIVVEPIEAQNNLPIEAQNATDLPIVVEPIEAQNNLPIEAQNKTDLPIVVEPIEAQNNLPIEAQKETDLPIEAQNIDDLSLPLGLNDPQITNNLLLVNYGKELQGLVITDRELESHYCDIHTALLNTFLNYSYAILILEGYMMALMKQTDIFYLFDPHARDIDGMPDPYGTAVVMKFTNILELEHFLFSLATKLHTNLYEIVPVDISNALKQTIKSIKNCEYQRKRRSCESEHDKQVRVMKANEYKKRKQSEQTGSDKQSTLQKVRESMKRKRLEESDHDRQRRCQKDSASKKRKRSVETDHERQTRLEKDRLHYKQKQTISLLQRQEEIDQHGYLNMFDNTSHGGIEQQSWAKSNIDKSHKSLQYFVSQCTICQEAWPLKSKPRATYVCSRCSRDKKSPKKFCSENSMIPSPVPHELQNLTQTEEMLIARALPIMRVYIKPGGQRGYSGHCINLPQNVTELAKSLPRYPKDLAIIIVKIKGKDNTFKDVTVRKQKVHDALVWLKNNNPHYSELIINEHALNSLPENGVPPELMTVETDDDIISDEDCSSDMGPPTGNPSEDIVYNDSDMSSFLPVGEKQQQEIEAVKSQLSEHEPISWPTVENEPLNEYQISHLATMAFPTLFPDGKGDPTNQALLRDVPLQERIKHLLKSAEIVDGKWVYRFANHPRFSYWAFNMIQRKRILQQSGIFLKQNPGEAHLTLDELREMAAGNNANMFMSKVSRYVGNIAGTNAYWNRVREELKAIITNVGAPTLFFTFSSADMHWPELYALFNANVDCENANISSEVRRQNVINNPHLVDWFFTQRLESFVKHWLYETLGAKWHWFRYEYQGRGSIHCHGTAKLNNDPGLCQLTQTALKGFLAQKFKDENDVLIQQNYIMILRLARKQPKQYVSMLIGYYRQLIQIHQMKTSS